LQVKVERAKQAVEIVSEESSDHTYSQLMRELNENKKKNDAAMKA
jgi:hypothetical protein